MVVRSLETSPPTSIVVDASVSAKWVFPEVGSPSAMALLREFQRGRLRLLAPDLWVAEVTSIAWKECALKHEITADEARLACDTLQAASPLLSPSSQLCKQALSIALAHRRPVYDCFYVALALQEHCDLVTADRMLVQALNPVFGCLRVLE